MTPKKSETELVREYFDKWSWFVEHWGWRFCLRIHDSLDDMPSAADEDTIAITFADFQYLEGSVHFNAKKIAGMQAKEIEDIVIHELSHFLVAPLQSNKENLEITVTMVARVIKGLNDSMKRRRS